MISGLSRKEAVRRLLKMRARAEKQNIREPISGATRPPLPYRFPLLGVSIAAPVSKTETPPREREKPKLRKCLACARIKRIASRGLCSPCYREQRKAEKQNTA